MEVSLMYDDIIDKRDLQERFDDTMECAFLDFYASRALDPPMMLLKDDLSTALRLAFLAGYEAAGGHLSHPPASP